MKRHIVFIMLLFTFAVEIAALISFAISKTDNSQEVVAVNEIVHSVQNDWELIESHINETGFDYVVLDEKGNVLYKTKAGLSESINAAIRHRDTILDIVVDDLIVGKLIIYNGEIQYVQSEKQTIVYIIAAILLVQYSILIGYFIYLSHNVIKPFEMDRHNLFGAFTESFDIMRSELKRARIAEAKANESKKELVAKLSHDIKTPVASIKAASEVGAALAVDEKIKGNYEQIIRKADQINALVINLFTVTLDELQELSITPADMESKELKTLLENADYLHYAVIPTIPDCLLFADRLRLQQVFDNLFANSYKYANTKIELIIRKENGFLSVSIEDYGGGVKAEEIPLIKEKYKRGSNTKNTDGACILPTTV